jgi:hypothetical protein
MIKLKLDVLRNDTVDDAREIKAQNDAGEGSKCLFTIFKLTGAVAATTLAIITVAKTIVDNRTSISTPA